jgi:NAD(P)-dependent dehydrogenase (short-subunit alcohol dehydrogenase family)
VAVIVGAGRGLSASLARKLAAQGARDVSKLSVLVADTGARAVACDVSEPEQVEALFEDVDAAEGGASLVVFNPSRRVPGPLVEVDPGEVSASLMTTAFGGFLVGQAAAHAGPGWRQHFVHRRLGERQGLSEVGGLRHG